MNEKAYDQVFDTVDDWLLDGEFQKVDCWLETVRSCYLVFGDNIINLIVASLTITRPARKFLNERETFADWAKEYLAEHDPDRLDVLLQGII